MWRSALFTDVITTVCHKVANYVGFVYRPCIRVHDRVHGRVQAVFTAVTPPVHGPVHGRLHGRVHGCVPAVNMAVLYRPCTRAIYVHGPWKRSVYTVVYGIWHVYTACRARTCLRPVHIRVPVSYTHLTLPTNREV